MCLQEFILDNHSQGHSGESFLHSLGQAGFFSVVNTNWRNTECTFHFVDFICSTYVCETKMYITVCRGDNFPPRINEDGQVQVVVQSATTHSEHKNHPMYLSSVSLETIISVEMGLQISEMIICCLKKCMLMFSKSAKRN